MRNLFINYSYILFQERNHNIVIST